MAKTMSQIRNEQILRARDKAMGMSARPQGSPAMMSMALNNGATMAGPLGSGIGSVGSAPVNPALLGLPPTDYGIPPATADMSSRVEGTSPLPVMDEDDQNIIALAKSYLAQGIAPDMATAMQMAREYAGRARAEASAMADAAVAAGDAQAAGRQAGRAMAQGVVPMDGETGADVRFRNRPLDQQELNLGYQQDTADRVTRGLRDGSISQPGSDAWTAESEHNYAIDQGIDEPGDAEIVKWLARRLGRDPRPEEVADEKKWRGWVNETPGSERQARYNKAEWDRQYEENQSEFNEAERRKYGGPQKTRTIGPDGNWVDSSEPLTDEQKLNRQTRKEVQDRARDADAGNRRNRLIVRAGLSDAEAKDMTEEELRGIGDRNRMRTTEGRTQRRLDTAFLAGGSHNLNSGNQGAFNRISELNPEDRVRALLYSGPGGALAAQVDAQGLQNMMRMMNAEALAGADPFNRGLLAQRANEQRRKENPTLAGEQDLGGGRETSPEAMAEAERLAEQFDSGGWNTMSWEDEARLADHLFKKFDIPRPTAEEIANRAANKRRWSWLQGKRPDAGAPGAAAPPPGPAAGEMPPVSI
jgi:hypothetical protein